MSNARVVLLYNTSVMQAALRMARLRLETPAQTRSRHRLEQFPVRSSLPASLLPTLPPLSSQSQYQLLLAHSESYSAVSLPFDGVLSTAQLGSIFGSGIGGSSDE